MDNRTVSRVVSILELVAAEQSGMTLTQLSRALDAPKSSVHGIVRTLEHSGYLFRSRSTYHIGPSINGLAAASSTSVIELAKPVIEKLAMDFDETVLLGTRVGEAVAYQYFVESAQPVRFSPPRVRKSQPRPSSIMKLYLAYRSVAERESYLTSHILDAEERVTMDNELATVRATGFAYNRGETAAGLTAIAIGLFAESHLMAGISIAGPTDRMNPQLERMADGLTAANRQISDMLGHLDEA
ncbi:IclR family transcriptional regulator [Williamsia limnetica]|uniref:IclR family transcriptional regulator n=2 Tax=Williamsia limnetica TaxID=882452 RepID=A0A318RGK9_WILLI|nr:IclR family transcriptional regulator [Williamsia limnetica]